MDIEFNFTKETTGYLDAVTGEWDYQVWGQVYWGAGATRWDPPEPDELDITKVIDNYTKDELLLDDIDEGLWDEIETAAWEYANVCMNKESPN